MATTSAAGSIANCVSVVLLCKLLGPRASPESALLRVGEEVVQARRRDAEEQKRADEVHMTSVAISEQSLAFLGELEADFRRAHFLEKKVLEEKGVPQTVQSILADWHAEGSRLRRVFGAWRRHIQVRAVEKEQLKDIGGETATDLFERYRSQCTTEVRRMTLAQTQVLKAYTYVFSNSKLEHVLF